MFLTAGHAQAAPALAAPSIGIYTLATFNGVPANGATQPDDLAISVDGKNLWVGYGNGVDTTGKSGSSNAVEYDTSSGVVLRNVSVPGHLDGLKINPTIGDVWATENEDGNPTLAIIEHESGEFKVYTFNSTLITGGMDLVLTGPESTAVFVVTSSQTDFTKPVIVEISAKRKGRPLRFFQLRSATRLRCGTSSRMRPRLRTRLVIPIR